jgi:hypothetical protein
MCGLGRGWLGAFAGFAAAAVLLIAPSASQAYNLWDLQVQPSVYCQVDGLGPTVSWNSDATIGNNGILFFLVSLSPLQLAAAGQGGDLVPNQSGSLNSSSPRIILLQRDPTPLSPQVVPNGWYVLVVVTLDIRQFTIGFVPSNAFFLSTDGLGCPGGPTVSPTASVRREAAAAVRGKWKRHRHALLRRAKGPQHHQGHKATGSAAP